MVLVPRDLPLGSLFILYFCGLNEETIVRRDTRLLETILWQNLCQAFVSCD